MLKVEMQTIENYADNPSDNYWKFKGGNTIGIFGSDDGPANAIASLLVEKKDAIFKEFPFHWEVIRNGNVDDIDLFFRYESDGSLKRIVDVKGA